MRISFHYGKEVDVKNEAKSFGVHNRPLNPENEQGESTGGRVRIFTTNGFFPNSMNSIDNFKSTIQHEIYHTELDYNNAKEEVAVTIKQIKSDSFKNTTKEFKDGTMGHLQEALEKLYKSDSKSFEVPHDQMPYKVIYMRNYVF